MIFLKYISSRERRKINFSVSYKVRNKEKISKKLEKSKRCCGKAETEVGGKKKKENAEDSFRDICCGPRMAQFSE